MGQNVSTLLRYSAAAPNQVTVRSGVTFLHSNVRPLKLDLYHPATSGPAARPCVLFLHGGAWRYGSRRTNSYMCRYLAARGFVCASADYRLTREAHWPAQKEDSRAALGWLSRNAAEFGGDGSLIGAMGTSAGAHLAALLALEAVEPQSPFDLPAPRIRAVCDWYGPSCLDGGQAVSPTAERAVCRLLGGHPRDLPGVAAEASPLRQVGPGAPPFLIIHGTADRIVPFEQSVWLHEALRSAGGESVLIAVRGGAHGRFLATSPGVGDLLDACARFFHQRLQPGPRP